MSEKMSISVLQPLTIKVIDLPLLKKGAEQVLREVMAVRVYGI